MNTRDQIEALNDALAIRAGIRKANVMTHPAAEEFAGNNVLATLAEAYGALIPRKGNGPTAAFAAGLSSSEFTAALANTVRSVFVSRLSAFDEHRAICAVRELINFRLHSFPVVDADPLLDEISESMEFHNEVRVATMDGLSARVRSFGKNVYCSRELIKNDDIALLSGLVANMGASAARLEAKLVWALLESNPLLGDQMAMFHEDHGNLGAPAALDLTSISAGVAALRNMLLPSGEKANLKPASIVVAPQYELSTKAVLKLAASESIQVIPSPWIDSTNWYLASDPQIAPVISLLYLKGAQRGVVVGKARQTASQQSRDGVALGIRFDVGVVPVGRIGIYKGRIGG